MTFRSDEMGGDLRNRVIEALKSIEDPEIGIDVWNLGLIYDVLVDEVGVVRIIMTLTAPGCPVSKYILYEVYKKVLLVEGVRDVHVDVVFTPRWSPLNITPEGRERFKSRYGYDIVEKYLELSKKS